MDSKDIFIRKKNDKSLKLAFNQKSEFRVFSLLVTRKLISKFLMLLCSAQIRLASSDNSLDLLRKLTISHCDMDLSR